MPQAAALTVNDGQSTPATFTYNPAGYEANGTRQVFLDRSPAIPAGFRRISYEVLPPNKDRTVHRILIGFSMPSVWVDKVLRVQSAQVILNVHPESSLQERKDLLAVVANTLDEADLKTAVENVESFW
jgi:hypothetical protein